MTNKHMILNSVLKSKNYPRPIEKIVNADSNTF